MSSSSIEFGVTTCLCLSSIVFTTSLTLMPLISENCFTGTGGVTSNDFGAASAISGAFDDRALALAQLERLLAVPLAAARAARRRASGCRDARPGRGSGFGSDGLRLGACGRGGPARRARAP